MLVPGGRCSEVANVTCVACVCVCGVCVFVCVCVCGGGVCVVRTTHSYEGIIILCLSSCAVNISATQQETATQFNT